MKINRRQRPSSPPIAATAALVEEAPDLKFYWSNVSITGADEVTAYLTSQVFVAGGSPTISSVATYERNVTGPSSDAVIRRGAALFGATSWSCNAAGKVIFKFGTTPVAADFIAFRPTVAQTLPIPNGVVPVLWIELT